MKEGVESPKPPSSGLSALSDELIETWILEKNVTFKVVVFTEEDFDWAKNLYDKTARLATKHDIAPIPFYLQAGTSVSGDAVEAVLNKYKWLLEYWLASGTMQEAVVLPQAHVLAWGRRKGA